LLKEAVRKVSFLIRRNPAFRHGRSDPSDAQAAAQARDLLAAAAWFVDVTDARTWADVTRLHEMAEGLEPTNALIAAHLAGRHARAFLEGYARDEKGLERAADLLARAVSVEASNPEVLLARCYLRQARREYEEAQEACRAALERDPSLARAAIEIGDAYLELARPDEALRWYRRAAAMPSAGRDVRFAHRGIAVASFLAGDYEQAIHWMGQAVAAKPADPVARGWLAAMLALAGRPTEAQAEAAAFFAMPGDGVRRAGDLPRVHLVAPEYDGRNALIQNALAKLRGAGGQPVR
jgi:tetratricopeptide (TPR) repeat protein